MSRAGAEMSPALGASTPNQMIIIEHQQPRAQAPTRGMLLHCGAQTVSRAELFDVPTPRGTQTWYPLAHRKILTEVETQLETSGFTILEETHALSHNGERYFGVMSVSLPNRGQADFGWIVGIRNSHDMTYPAGLVAGTRVLVCDNLVRREARVVDTEIAL